MKTSKNSRLALSIAGALCSLPLFLTNAHAFGGPPGGPFSNGSYFPNDGTFSAVVRGTDAAGILQFSTTSGNTGIGSSGVSTIYYDGDTYIGNSQGAYDPSASTMMVNFQAGSQGQGQWTIDVIKSVLNSSNSTDTGKTIPYQQVNFFDSLYLNGYADCKTSNSFPNQKFSGSGKAELQILKFNGNIPFLDAVDFPIAVSGVRLSNTASTFTQTAVRPPSFNQFILLSNP